MMIAISLRRLSSEVLKRTYSPTFCRRSASSGLRSQTRKGPPKQGENVAERRVGVTEARVGPVEAEQTVRACRCHDGVHHRVPAVPRIVRVVLVRLRFLAVPAVAFVLVAFALASVLYAAVGHTS